MAIGLLVLLLGGGAKLLDPLACGSVVALPWLKFRREDVGAPHRTAAPRNRSGLGRGPGPRG